jgi:signal transduction histidine kinase
MHLSNYEMPISIITFIRVKILRKFINLKVLSQKNLPYDEIIRIELLVATCLFSFLLGMSYILVGLSVNISLLSIINYLVLFLTMIPLVLFLTKKGYPNEAKLMMMLVGNIFMFIKASSYGRESGMNLAMLIMLFAIFAFYSIEDYKYMLFALAATLSIIVFLELTDYSFIGNDKSTNKYEYEYNLASTILFCILFFYVTLRVNQYMNKKLSLLNHKLLNKNKMLGKINKELDSYIYKASHDMRAPLTSMMGILNLIKTETDPEKIKHLNSLQEKCISKLDSHIYQIINLSKNIKTESIPEKTDLNLMINEVFEELNFFENAANTKKIIRIEQDVAFYSDPYRLKMILNNLISNAFKYTRFEEAIPLIEVEALISRDSATITVKDNGIGIPNEQQGKIFDMFYRGTDASKGSGLGLYMVKEMIEKLNGSISVHSEENRFTFITFVIPNNFQRIETTVN